MSLKTLKKWISTGRNENFKEIHSVLKTLEDLHNKKVTVFNKLQSKQINNAVFQIKFYALLDEDKFLSVLEEIFSNTVFLNEINELRTNIDEQKILAFAKSININTLAKKLEEEHEILAIEEKIVQQEESKQIISENKQKSAETTFENINIESVSSKEHILFDKSLITLRNRGYQRHLRPQEAFAIIIAYLPEFSIENSHYTY